MALKIGITSYVSGGYTNPVIWRLYETGSGVFIDDHQEMGPHGVVYNFEWTNNIRDIVYTVKMYEQPGGTGVGTLIKAHDITVSTSTLIFDSDIETIVDGGEPEDPVSGENTSPIIDSLVGKDFYVVQRGVGQLRAEREIEIINNGDGSYSFTGDQTFNEGDTLIIKIRPAFVVNPAGTYTGGDIYKDIVLITADTTIDSSYFGKMLIIEGALPVLTLQFDAISAIIEKLSLHIKSIGTTHLNVVCKMATGETITAVGATSNTFILGRGTEAEIVKLGSTMYGFTDDVDIKKRGQLEWAYYIGLNRVAADGTEYLVADYPGLKKALDNMPAGVVTDYTNWGSSFIIDYGGGDSELIYPYKGKFALSGDSLNFKVPDLRANSIRALKYLDATTDGDRIVQGAGGYQHQSIRKHNHAIDTTNSAISGAAGADPTRGSLAGSPNTKGAEGENMTIHQYIDPMGSPETRGNNVGLIPVIII